MVTNCGICGKEMKVQPKRIRRLKHGLLTCSRECGAKHRSIFARGENNHQFGLTGDKNASYKGKETISNYGYVLEYCPGHPQPHDKSIKGVRVKQHRLIIERNHHLFNPDYFENIDGWIVLKKEFDVHHKNNIRTDNRLENLDIMTRSEHSIHHNILGTLPRDEKGRTICRIKKQSETK